MKLIDLSGKRFGRLTVVSRDHSRTTDTYWFCTCDCGTTKSIAAYTLTKGLSKSCGCLRTEIVRARSITHGNKINRKASREYKSWSAMKSRCYRATNKKYHRYGGRGITVCDSWRDSFSNFLRDMGPAPSGTTIDRINNDGNYEPGNCKWSTSIEQGNNTSSCLEIPWNGEVLTLAQVARAEGVGYKSLHTLYRYRHMSVQDAVLHLKAVARNRRNSPAI
jgi:hypothetical protein